MRQREGYNGLCEGERKSAAETQLKYLERVVRRVQIGLVCSADLRGVSALLRHSLRAVGRLAGRERGFLLGARSWLVSWLAGDGLPDLQAAQRACN